MQKQVGGLTAGRHQQEGNSTSRATPQAMLASHNWSAKGAAAQGRSWTHAQALPPSCRSSTSCAQRARHSRPASMPPQHAASCAQPHRTGNSWAHSKPLDTSSRMVGTNTWRGRWRAEQATPPSVWHRRSLGDTLSKMILHTAPWMAFTPRPWPRGRCGGWAWRRRR